jgi:hypothetical protein
MDLIEPKREEKTPFLAQKCRFEVILKLLRPLGGLGGSNGSKIARGHCIMYKKGARQLSSGSADPTDFDWIQALKVLLGAYTWYK